jgi:hypothetical protein
MFRSPFADFTPATARIVLFAWLTPDFDAPSSANSRRVFSSALSDYT